MNNATAKPGGRNGVRSFRDSIAWQKAMELATAVYVATRPFPKEELFGLTSQLRRASVSVASNIAEGQGRLTKGEFKHFLGMSRGSLQEVLTQLDLSLRLGFGNEADLLAADLRAVELMKIINSILSNLRNQNENPASDKP